jgi:hypothetical protein
MLINCLEYCLLFWELNPNYKIYYNSDHCVNSDKEIGGGFLPVEKFGYEYFISSFNDLLSDDGFYLLAKYFNKLSK